MKSSLVMKTIYAGKSLGVLAHFQDPPLTFENLVMIFTDKSLLLDRLSLPNALTFSAEKICRRNHRTFQHDISGSIKKRGMPQPVSFPFVLPSGLV